jgi:hypothetical protein
MPRYYFHLTDGKETVKNPEGMDLSGTAAAREEAMVLARDLKHGKVMPGRSWNGWLVSVVDQHGHQVEAVPIADLLDEERGRRFVSQRAATRPATDPRVMRTADRPVAVVRHAGRCRPLHGAAH